MNLTLIFLTVKEPKDFVYLLDNCPHDWLFLHCIAVVRRVHISIFVHVSIVVWYNCPKKENTISFTRVIKKSIDKKLY